MSAAATLSTMDHGESEIALPPPPLASPHPRARSARTCLQLQMYSAFPESGRSLTHVIAAPTTSEPVNRKVISTRWSVVSLSAPTSLPPVTMFQHPFGQSWLPPRPRPQQALRTECKGRELQYESVAIAARAGPIFARLEKVRKVARGDPRHDAEYRLANHEVCAECLAPNRIGASRETGSGTAGSQDARTRCKTADAACRGRSAADALRAATSPPRR